MHKDAYHLILTDGARNDLHSCKKEDGYAAALIAQHLRELENNPGWCELLVDKV